MAHFFDLIAFLERFKLFVPSKLILSFCLSTTGAFALFYGGIIDSCISNDTFVNANNFYVHLQSKHIPNPVETEKLDDFIFFSNFQFILLFFRRVFQ